MKWFQQVYIWVFFLTRDFTYLQIWHFIRSDGSGRKTQWHFLYFLQPTVIEKRPVREAVSQQSSDKKRKVAKL